MPLTPLHWTVLLFGFLAASTFYLPSLLLSSTLIDIETFVNALYFIFVSRSGPCIHCFFHTYLGASILGALVGFILVKTRKKLDLSVFIFKIDQSKVSDLNVYVSSFIGAWSHVFLDSFVYPDITPFWPLSNANPLLYFISTAAVYLILFLGFLLCSYFFIFSKSIKRQ